MYIRLLINTLCEFIPIASFVAVSEYIDFIQGVKVLVIATIIATLISWYTEKHIPKFGITAAITILLFGFLTLYFDDPFFIIIKDTFYYAGFAVALLIGMWQGKSVFRFFFGDFFAMTEKGWRVLEIRWTIFFIVLAIANEIARANLSPHIWAEYKFLVLLTTWVFGFYQLTLSKRERLSNASPLGLKIKVV